jgi:hypothetical protein
MTYSEIGLTELVDLENTILDLLPDAAFTPASMYKPLTDPTLANPIAVDVSVMPVTKSVQKTSSVDLQQLRFKAGQVPAPANVVNVTTGINQSAVDRWYICLKLDTLGPIVQRAIPIASWAVEMPYTLTVQRPTATPGKSNGLDIFGAPNAVDTSGYPTFTTTDAVLRVGLSSQFNPLVETIAGALPKGQLTAYTHLNAPVQLDDALTFNGKTYVVSQINNMDADGFVYGLLLLLTETGGQTYANQP